MVSKQYKVFTVVLLCLLIVSLVGNFYQINNRQVIKTVQIQSSEEEYEQKYADFDKQDKKVKKSIYEGTLAAGTSPTEVKYLLMKLKDDLNDEEKDQAIAQYINHIQYFASVFTSLTVSYENIIRSLSDSIDFSTRDSAFQVSDKVLRNLLLEIWDSDMILYIPASTSSTLSVIVDYDSLKETYKDFITSKTAEYLDLKSSIINGNIYNNDGSISYSKLEEFMKNTYSFIYAYPDFAIIEDVQYMYVVAAKMYFNIYNTVVEDVVFTDEDVSRITDFVNKYADSPASDIGKTLLAGIVDGRIDETTYNEVLSAFDALSA